MKYFVVILYIGILYIGLLYILRLSDIPYASSTQKSTLHTTTPFLFPILILPVQTITSLHPLVFQPLNLAVF